MFLVSDKPLNKALAYHHTRRVVENVGVLETYTGGPVGHSVPPGWMIDPTDKFGTPPRLIKEPSLVSVTSYFKINFGI